MASTLDDILTQIADRTKLLETISVSHRRALMNPEYNDDLDTIREQISDTLDELCSLNDGLISYNGPIRSEMSTLSKNKDKLKQINFHELELLRDQEKWENFETGGLQSTTDTDKAAPEEDQKHITISTNYRKGLDEYLNMVGAENTTLTEQSQERDNNNQKMILENFQNEYNLLCRTLATSDNEISKLETILNEFKKDNTFLRKEMKSRQNKVKNHKMDINLQLRQLANERNELLDICGYIVESSPSATRTLIDSLIRLSVNKPDIESIIEEKVAEYAKIFEFIDIKTDTLEHMLQQYKSRQSEWKEMKQSWDENMKFTSQLENELRQQIQSASEVGLEIKPEQISSQISIKISQMEELLSVGGTNSLINPLINDEIESLRIALSELGFDEKKDTTNLHTKPNIPNPSLKMISKSPPKTGFSETNVNFQNVQISAKKRD